MPEKRDYGKLLDRLRDPLQLRVFVAVVGVCVGYLGIYAPLDGRIKAVRRQLAEEKQREVLVEQIEHLRAEVDKVDGRLPKDADSNQWIQYVLDGVRTIPLKLLKLDSDAPVRVGPYDAVVLTMQLEGEFQHIDQFLWWLESNERLFRVDAANITPAKEGDDRLVMQLTLMGMNG
jgi:hypothetical protein